jgi:hypothetical protein
MGRAPGCAERCALSKISARSSGAIPCNCPLAMTELATSNSPHVGQAMLTPSIVVAILSAPAPQIGQSMSEAPDGCDLIENNGGGIGGFRVAVTP